MMDDFDAYLAEQMRDPRYRFWHYVYAPRFWLRGKLISFLFWLRDAAHEAGCQVLGTRPIVTFPTDDECAICVYRRMLDHYYEDDDGEADGE